ncbi:MAG: hypothetical protein AAFY71_27060 [Bacteroidota bacterium]
MKRIILWIALLCLGWACLPISSDESSSSANFLTADLIDSSSHTFLKMLTWENKVERAISWGNPTYSFYANLDSLVQGQGYRIPPTVLWVNDQYICLQTLSSGSQSQRLFLPLDSAYAPHFIPETVVWEDTANNQICYLNSSTADSSYLQFVYQDLISSIQKKFWIPKPMNWRHFPFGDEASRRGDSLFLMLQGNPPKEVGFSLYVKK